MEIAKQQILLSALKGSFWSAVWRWVAGALFYTLLLFVFAVGLARSGVDLMEILKKIISPH